MLRRATCVGAVILAAALVFPIIALAGPMTPGERQRLIAHLQMTEDWLAASWRACPTAQLTFKMTPESWSITEVAEHLAIAEPQYWTNLEASMKDAVNPGGSPRRPTRGCSGTASTARTARRTGEARVPHGQFPNAQASLASFRKLRATMLLDGEELAGGLPRPQSSWAAARTSISGS